MPTRKSMLNRAIGAITVLMVALAAGAAWCVLQLIVRLDMIGLAPVVAALVAWMSRRYGFAQRWSGALLAAFATAVACTYAQLLLAAATVAAFLGESMRSTLMKIGFDMAKSVAWANLSQFHVGMLVAAIFLSAWLVMRGKPVAVVT